MEKLWLTLAGLIVVAGISVTAIACTNKDNSIREATINVETNIDDNNYINAEDALEQSAKETEYWRIGNQYWKEHENEFKYADDINKDTFINEYIKLRKAGKDDAGAIEEIRSQHWTITFFDADKQVYVCKDSTEYFVSPKDTESAGTLAYGNGYNASGIVEKYNEQKNLKDILYLLNVNINDDVDESSVVVSNIGNFVDEQTEEMKNRSAVITNENGEKLYTFINGTPLTEEEAIKEIIKEYNLPEEELIGRDIKNYEIFFDGTLSDDKPIEQIIKEQFGFNDEQIRNVTNNIERWDEKANPVKYGWKYDRNGILTLRGLRDFSEEAIRLGYIKPDDVPEKLGYWLSEYVYGEDKYSADYEIDYFGGKSTPLDPYRLVPYVEGQMIDYMTGNKLSESCFGGYNGDGYYGYSVWIWRDPDNGNILALDKKDYNYFKYGEVESYKTHFDHGYADN